MAVLLTSSSHWIPWASFTSVEWFCLVVTLGFAVVFWITYRIRLTRHTSRVCNMFAERLSERERSAGELNDILLQSMQGLILLFQAAAIEIPLQAPGAAQLETAINRAERVMVEARDKVRGLQAPHLDLADALRSINAEEPLPGTEYSVQVVGRKRELQTLVSDEVFKIAHEAIANAFQHALASHVEVKLTYRHTSLCLVVTDDGSDRVIDVAEDGGTGRWGYSSMKSRARKLEATLMISNRSPTGTEVQLSVPSTVAYRTRTWFTAEWLQTVRHFLERRGH
jgi:signal transduction histidine kinase